MPKNLVLWHIVHMTKSKIYTRTGDKGETSLFTGERVSKDNPFIQALGAVDECNSAIGMSLSFLPHKPALEEVEKQLIQIQHALFDLGAAVATPRTSATKNKIAKTRFDEEAITWIEQWIDEMDHQLPRLTTFILPGGHPAGAALHCARSICRRAEQILVPLNTHEDVSDHVLRFLNRVSDYLFIASRFINHVLSEPETLWEHHKHI